MTTAWTSKKINNFLNLTFSPEETVEQFQQLSPQNVSAETFQLFLESMASFCRPLPDFSSFELMDCCGTGGSGKSFFNTSTAMAFVLAAGGVPVLKFGNRAISSQSGSFDFLESLGIPSQFPVKKIPHVLDQAGVAFLFAPECYPQLASFHKIRKQLNTKTIFNFIGPLLNPTQPVYRLIGVSDSCMLQQLHSALTTTPAHAFFKKNKRSLLVYSQNTQLDEFSCIPQDIPEVKEAHAPTLLPLLENISFSLETHLFKAKSVELPLEKTAEDWNCVLAKQAATRTSQDNVETFLKLVDTTEATFLNLPWLEQLIFKSLVLNAGAGFWIAGKVPSIDAGLALATELMVSGKVCNTVELCRRAYQHHA